MKLKSSQVNQYAEISQCQFEYVEFNQINTNIKYMHIFGGVLHDI